MKQIIWFVKTYATFVVLFVLQKPLFLFLEKGSATQPVDNIFTELPAVIWHGLPLDLSMAGYLSVIPGFLSIAVVWLKRDLVKPIMNIYFIIASLFITCSFLLNASLYPYWKYPLDSTPLFYFFTSPASCHPWAHTRMLQYAWIPSPSRVFYLQDSMPTVSVRTEAWFPY